jgi:hypothetical protein
VDVYIPAWPIVCARAAGRKLRSDCVVFVLDGDGPRCIEYGPRFGSGIASRLVVVL